MGILAVPIAMRPPPIMELLDDGSSGRRLRRRLADGPSMQRPAPVPGNADRIRYASDCSGMDGGALALKALRMPFVHEFGSEIAPSCRRVFEHLHPDCNALYADITERNFKLLKERHCVTMYTSGFPCQPCNNQGLRLGQADPLGRGLIIHWVINAIRVLRPV